MEKDRLTIRFDDDVLDSVLERHEKTGKNKAKIVNENLRRSFNHDEPSLMDSIMPVFGQGLFVAGFIVALIANLYSGVGLALVGLAMMIGAKVDEYSSKHDVAITTALIRVLGA